MTDNIRFEDLDSLLPSNSDPQADDKILGYVDGEPVTFPANSFATSADLADFVTSSELSDVSTTADNASTAITNHIADSDSAHVASSIAYTTGSGALVPSGTDNVQEVLNLVVERGTLYVPYHDADINVYYQDGYMSPGSTTLILGENTFSPSDVGRLVLIHEAGSGGDVLVTQISAYIGSTSVTLADANASGNELSAVTVKTGIDSNTIITAINTALSEGTVNKIKFPDSAQYLTTTTIALTSDLTIEGGGQDSTEYHMWSDDTAAFDGDDLEYVTMRDFKLWGTGQDQDRPINSGHVGVLIDKSANPANFSLTFERMHIEGFYDGMNIDTPIVSSFNRVWSFRNTRYGIDTHGEGDSAGTSVDWTACFTAGNWHSGFHINQMAYCSLNGCAADANGVGYWYQNCSGITENGCGTEESYNFEASGQVAADTPSGLSRYIQNSRVVMNSPYIIGTVKWGIHVFANCYLTINSLYEGSVGNAEDVNADPEYSIYIEPEDLPNEILKSHVVLSMASHVLPFGGDTDNLVILEEQRTVGVGMVNHGATADTARPTGYAMVLWYGSVQPDNMVAPDIWFNTA